MGFIKDFLARRNENDLKLKEAQSNDRVFNTVEERKKSHAERELIKVLEEERQENIKEALKYENKKRQIKEKLSASNMLKFDPSSFRHESILKEKRNFLNGGNF